MRLKVPARLHDFVGMDRLLNYTKYRHHSVIEISCKSKNIGKLA